MSDTVTKNLNPLSIFVGFLPWIAFTFMAQRLAANGVAWSALFAAALSLVFVVRGRRENSPILLESYSLMLFTVMAVAGSSAINGWTCGCTNGGARSRV